MKNELNLSYSAAKSELQRFAQLIDIGGGQAQGIGSVRAAFNPFERFRFAAMLLYSLFHNLIERHQITTGKLAGSANL